MPKTDGISSIGALSPHEVQHVQKANLSRTSSAASLGDSRLAALRRPSFDAEEKEASSGTAGGGTVLGDLPLELLYHVMTYVRPEDRVALASTSRGFHYALAPIARGGPSKVTERIAHVGRWGKDVKSALDVIDQYVPTSRRGSVLRDLAQFLVEGCRTMPDRGCEQMKEFLKRAADDIENGPDELRGIAAAMKEIVEREGKCESNIPSIWVATAEVREGRFLAEAAITRHGFDDPLDKALVWAAQIDARRNGRIPTRDQRMDGLTDGFFERGTSVQELHEWLGAGLQPEQPSADGAAVARSVPIAGQIRNVASEAANRLGNWFSSRRR